MKLYHTTNRNSWLSRWMPRRNLPRHLPRLVLADHCQPRFVRRCALTQTILPTLQLLDWEQLPTTLAMQDRGERTVPLAAYVGAYLVKLDQRIPTFAALRRFLRTHPALVWALGFPLIPTVDHIDADACLPSERHFTKKLSTIPNELLQSLLDSQVIWLRERFGDAFGDTVSLDTKHILAWVKENNPKTFIKEGRFDKTQQPVGDADCKLGCKRRRNQVTPTKEGQPASAKASVGEYYWGYASGAVATIVPHYGEFVLAELTQTFDHGDATYFFPLMAQVEQRLGRRPRFAAADAAFDSFYVYDYFHSPDHDGFAAVPLRQMGTRRHFSTDGLPLCAAQLAMPLKGKFTNRTSLVQHKRGRYVCPLHHPEFTGEPCPIDHDKWEESGCKVTMPLAAGARIRYQLDRDGADFKAIYDQRTAVERIFSQAVALGIERPKLRNGPAIANSNTLTYLLINLRAMLRAASKSATAES